MMEHWFWTLIVALVLIWYVVVTFIVSVRGGKDIREMIKDLQAEDDSE